MYIDSNTIIHAAELIGACGVIIGLIVGIYRILEGIKSQGQQISEIMAELAIIDRGLKGALEGLIEQGANGPCREALAKLDEHLIAQAHGGATHENK